MQKVVGVSGGNMEFARLGYLLVVVAPESEHRLVDCKLDNLSLARFKVEFFKGDKLLHRTCVRREKVAHVKHYGFLACDDYFV